MLTLNMFYLVGTTTLFDNADIPQLPTSSYLTPPEHVIEIASRLCYNSLDKLGTNPNFLQGLVKVGHMDVLEHGIAVFRMSITVSDEQESMRVQLLLNQMCLTHRYIGELVIDIDKLSGGKVELDVIIGANLRTWLEIVNNQNLFHNNEIYQTISYSLGYYLRIIAPHVFSLNYHPSSPMLYLPKDIEQEVETLFSRNNRCKDIKSVVTDSGARITPLGYCDMNGLSNCEAYYQMAYMLSGVSRAFSHQHVRHRKLSFSQLSQRYVDFVNKQHGDFVYPPGELTDEQLAILRSLFERIKHDYELLRSTGMKKEDARCILPNASETSMVFSGMTDGLEHYFKLRTASDAQLEIRQVASAAMRMYNTVY